MAEGYLVLARKYRPYSFADLVGQEALVTTLSNAIKSNRIHHAYVLTGIRGVGKTTTARIIAKALNCENGPSVEWDAGDSQAKSIEEGRHVDVLEYDAASHTGIDDIKDLFEGVNYLPVMGRFKVYIIDEVHMLSTKAFNALLKTLEEPPAHVKFIFATTEVHKIPVTVLSRCQRFDLRRIPADTLCELYTSILTKEGIEADEAAVRMVARAADGSARDGLSLLDQSIALAAGEKVSEALVADMLGLGDRSRTFDLLGAIIKADAKLALDVFDDLYSLGQDPLLVMRELLQLTHLLTRVKVVPELKDSNELSEIERTRAVPLAAEVPLENLSRAYQLLLGALQEAKIADRPHEAVQMAIIRLTHLAPLPPIAQLLQQVEGKVAATPAGEPPAPKPEVNTSAADAAQGTSLVAELEAMAGGSAADAVAPTPVSQNLSAVPWEDEEPSSAPSVAAAPVMSAQTSAPVSVERENPSWELGNWRAAISAVKAKAGSFGAMVEHQVRCHDFDGAALTANISVDNGALSENEIVNGLRQHLKSITGKPWDIKIGVATSSAETVAETKLRETAEEIEEVKQTDDMRAILDAFPDMEITEVS